MIILNQNKVKGEILLDDLEQHFLDIQLNIANFIKDYINEKKMTYRDLEKSLNMSRGSIEYHLKGESDKNLIKLLIIAQRLGFTGTLQVNLEKPKEMV